MRRYPVSTLVVEWIEISRTMRCEELLGVSTLVVEWIEIPTTREIGDGVGCLHPRGGVD